MRVKSRNTVYLTWFEYPWREFNQSVSPVCPAELTQHYPIFLCTAWISSIALYRVATSYDSPVDFTHPPRHFRKRHPPSEIYIYLISSLETEYFCSSTSHRDHIFGIRSPHPYTGIFASENISIIISCRFYSIPRGITSIWNTKTKTAPDLRARIIITITLILFWYFFLWIKRNPSFVTPRCKARKTPLLPRSSSGASRTTHRINPYGSILRFTGPSKRLLSSPTGRREKAKDMDL